MVRLGRCGLLLELIKCEVVVLCSQKYLTLYRQLMLLTLTLNFQILTVIVFQK